MAETAAPPADLRPAKKIIYCGICTLPPEVGTHSHSPHPQTLPPTYTNTLPAQYCEYGGTTKKCEEWLSKNHPDLHSQLYSPEALSQNLSTLSVDAQKRAERDAQKKAAKAEANEAREAAARAASKIYIKRVERNKRKYVTEVSGLESFGLDLKKTAKEFGKKFATGSSVTKTASGGEEITVQGDVSDEIFDWIQENHGGSVPEENVELIEDKKKKGGGGGP